MTTAAWFLLFELLSWSNAVDVNSYLAGMGSQTSPQYSLEMGGELNPVTQKSGNNQSTLTTNSDDNEASNLTDISLSTTTPEDIVIPTGRSYLSGCGFSLVNCTCTYYKDTEDISVGCENVDIYKVAPMLPKNITRFYCSKCVNARILSNPILSHLTNLKKLIIHFSNVRYITPRFLTGLRSLTYLGLPNNFIRAVLPRFLNSTPDIQVLDMSGNNFIFVKDIANACAPLKYLTKISFSSNKILENIRADDFIALQGSYLEELDLKDCALVTVEEGAFKPLTNLKRLDLSVNTIGSGALMNITKDLQYTAIEHLELTDMPKLFYNNELITEQLKPLVYSNISSLNLNSNFFTRLNDYAFPEIRSLQILSLKNCKIQFIYNLTFIQLTGLEELYLNKNSLNSIGFVLPNLRVLDMSGNPQFDVVQSEFQMKDNRMLSFTNLKSFTLYVSTFLGPLTPSTFSGLANLERLEISGTPLENISDFSFRELGNLQHLLLNSNLLTTISSKMFVGLVNLTHLYLRNNRIGYISDQDVFRPLVSLEVLVLKANRIKQLPPNAFIYNVELDMVALGYNHIFSWEYDLFSSNGSMRVLLLEGNQIDHVTPAMLMVFKKLLVLDLSENPLNCKLCGMKEFQKWAVSENNSIVHNLYRKPETYICLNSSYSKISLLNATISDEHCFPAVDRTAQTIMISLFVTIPLIIGIVVVIYYLRWYIRYSLFSLKSRVRRFGQSNSTDKYVFDAFVSYSSEDLSWVSGQLVPNLEESQIGLRLCLHDRNFQVGLPITQNILEAIDKSRKTIMILTDDYVKSNWCMFELHMAQHRLFEDTRNALILVQLKELTKDKLPGHLKYLIKTRTYIDWTDPETSAVKNKLFWRRLTEAVMSPQQKETFGMLI